MENEEYLEKLINEAKEFIDLKNKFKRAKFPETGTPAYLISNNWLKKYKAYIPYK